MRKLSSLICVISVALLLMLLLLVDASAAANRGSDDELKLLVLKKGDLSVKLTNWGATVVSVLLPDRHGKLGDVVLGFDDLEDYKNDKSYFGAIVGRIANRVGGAKFTLNGKTYKLVANEGNNTLHGGKKGFSDVLWKVRKYRPDNVDSPYVTFSYSSFDGEQGFPGALDVYVTYTLLDGQRLSVTMRGHAKNKPTPVNLAQHTYWNLGGHNSGDILSNTIQLFASRITPVDNSLIPTGKIISIKGTPYDFLLPHTVGSRINELPHGYDINYVIDGHSHHSSKKVAVVHEPKSGRLMELWTNAPGVQLYTSNMLQYTKGKGGYVYKKHAAICLETQGFPDAVNHPNFPSQIVTPKKPYKHVMLYKFSVK
ncbi:hypothetical protein Sjap_015786 [Stephania japonica]|uniref:Aldose 1-epimerase n=1 Tax=Stephania japonica TaxID=461633 RepID=A0AAP0IJU9_9MAGN